MSIILCPKCQARQWSGDFFVCEKCGYSENRAEVLLEENKDFDESRDRGDNPQMDLGFWMDEQKVLTKEMINECLPKGKYNYVVDCSSDCGGDWGETEYCENDPQEVELFKVRHAKELIEKGESGWHWRVKGFLLNGDPVKEPIYPYRTGSAPTKIRIAKWALQTEGEYRFNGQGYFPTVLHETAHASPEVKRNPQFQPLSQVYSPGPGHDEIHNSKNREFYDKLTARGCQEKVKDRFKELRKIQKKE